MCDLLTDPYLDELRAMDARLYAAWLSSQLYEIINEHFHPLAASSVPSLSPDAGKYGAVGGLIEGVK